jgi:hypothetical protein
LKKGVSTSVGRLFFEKRRFNICGKAIFLKKGVSTSVGRLIF